MVTMDYHSGFFELDYRSETTSETIIGKLKNNFSRHGIPHTLVSDNGPQSSPAVFRTFTKRLLRKCKASREDPYLGLLNICKTPSEGSLFGRHVTANNQPSG